MGGFKKFLLRGNLIDLAVAVVIGIAFNAVVQALIKDIVTPLISAIGGKPIIAAVVYYLIVGPVNRLTALTQRNKTATERECPECLSTIPVGARRCMYCTAVVTPQA